MHGAGKETFKSGDSIFKAIWLIFGVVIYHQGCLCPESSHKWCLLLWFALLQTLYKQP
jgi:hypothetical protein